MKRNIKKADVKWSIVLNETGERDSFHGYYLAKKENPYGEDYFGNGSLCNINRFVSEDGGTEIDFSKIEECEIPDHIKCKSCLKIFNKLAK